MLPVHHHNNHVLVSKHDDLPFGVDAHFIPSSGPKPTVIFIHGFNGFKDWGHFPMIGDYFAQQGMTFIRFNLSHNGTTVERPSEIVNLKAYGNDLFSYDLDDIGLVLNFLHSRDCPYASEIDFENIFLLGHSRGGALAILKAAEDNRVSGVATWASIKSTSHFWIPEHVAKVEQDGVIYVRNGRTQQTLPLYYAYYEDVIFNPIRLGVERQLKEMNIPVLIAHGTHDTSVPTQYAHDMHAWNPNTELYLVDGANHTFGGKHPYEADKLPDASEVLAEKTANFFMKVARPDLFEKV